MEYKEVIVKLKQAVNELPEKRRYSKMWTKKNQSSWARFKEGTKLPRPDKDASSTRASVLCAILAHARGRLHFTRVGHWWDYNTKEALAGNNVYDVPKGEEGLKLQRKWIEGAIKQAKRAHEWNEKYPDRKWGVSLSQEEMSMVEFLLDAREQRRQEQAADSRGDAGDRGGLSGGLERSAAGV